jgi:hypothetical protein
MTSPIRAHLTDVMTTSSGLSIKLWNNHPLTWIVTDADGAPIPEPAGGRHLMAGDVCAYLEIAGFWEKFDKGTRQNLIDYESHLLDSEPCKILINQIEELQDEAGPEYWKYATLMQETLGRLLVSVVAKIELVEDVSQVGALLHKAVDEGQYVWVG